MQISFGFYQAFSRRQGSDSEKYPKKSERCFKEFYEIKQHFFSKFMYFFLKEVTKAYSSVAVR